MVKHYQQETEHHFFGSSLMNTSEVQNVLEKSMLLDQKNTPASQAEAKVLAHIIESIKTIKSLDDVNGMAKTLALIEQGESLLSAKKPGSGFFQQPSQTMKSTHELSVLKDFLREQIGQSMESRMVSTHS